MLKRALVLGWPLFFCIALFFANEAMEVSDTGRGFSLFLSGFGLIAIYLREFIRARAMDPHSPFDSIRTVDRLDLDRESWPMATWRTSDAPTGVYFLLGVVMLLFATFPLVDAIVVHYRGH